MQKEKNIIIFVMNVSPNNTLIRHLLDTFEKAGGQHFRIMLLWDSKIKIPAGQRGYDILVKCDFSKSEKIAEALLPYQDEILAITCRSEANLARFQQVIPNVPYLRTPSTQSLAWASDKYEMRKRLKLFDPKHTPRFTRVKNTSAQEIERVSMKVKFPMVIKPANLAASRYVSICYHPEELEKNLKRIFRGIKSAYKKDNRKEDPKVIAEEFMDGLMYSIDSYVDSRGGIVHCPLVRVKTGRDIGHDDFFGYLQTTPSILKGDSVQKAHAVTEKAIHALGLRSVTTHIELMRVDDDWKIIEVGARCGGFRDTLYWLSCGIHHAANDVLNRIPQKPVVPKKCQGYATAMKWFSKKEGIILEMKGIKKIEELDSFYKINVNKKIGDRAMFAKNGGRSIFNLFLYNSDRAMLLADIRRVEQTVNIKVGKKQALSTVDKTSEKKTVSKKTSLKKTLAVKGKKK